MKKSTGIKMLAFTLLAVLATACSKYEEGSKFTFLSKKSRVVNTWKMDKITSTVDATGTITDLTSIYPAIEIDFNKDDTYEVRTTVEIFGTLTTNTSTGTWAFNSDKTNLVTTDSNGNVDEATIIMLKKNEMKTQFTDNGITYLSEYSTK